MSESSPPGLSRLVESVSFGSAGLRYRRLNADVQIERFNEPYFIAAYQAHDLIGAYVIDRRTLKHQGKAITGFYRGLLAVHDDHQGQTVGQQLTRSGFRWIQEQAASQTNPVLTYGCIDTSNHRSLALLHRRGTVRLGGLSRFMMYSQWPHRGKVVGQIQAVEERLVSALVNETVADCLLRDVTTPSSEALGLIVAGDLVACARVSRSCWSIEDMGRFLGWTDRFLVRPFPVARRRFDSQRFECLQLNDIGLKVGSERYWRPFVVGLLAKHDLHFAMLLLDPGSALHHRLRSIGWLDPLIHGTKPDVHIVGRWLGNEASSMSEPHDITTPLALTPVDL